MALRDQIILENSLIIRRNEFNFVTRGVFEVAGNEYEIESDLRSTRYPRYQRFTSSPGVFGHFSSGGEIE